MALKLTDCVESGQVSQSGTIVSQVRGFQIRVLVWFDGLNELIK